MFGQNQFALPDNGWYIYDINTKQKHSLKNTRNDIGFLAEGWYDKYEKALIISCKRNNKFGLAFFDNKNKIKKYEIGNNHSQSIVSLDISLNKKYFATCSWDNDIWIWNYKIKKPLRKIKAHDNRLFDISFSPNSKYIASTSSDSTVKYGK